MMVRCIDNTLQRDLLDVGRDYEVIGVNDLDGYYILSGLGQFSKARFIPIDCKCGAKLDARGICPALCEPVSPPLPRYSGPAVIGRTHTGRMAGQA